MLTSFQDLHYAVRTLTRAPGFAIVAILTLGLGIGANTAIFSIVNAVLLRPLPYKDSDQLVRVLQQNPNAMEVTERRSAAINQEHFLPWRARTQTLSHLAAFERQPMLLGGRAEPVRLPGARVSAAMFPMLGASPEIGRGFDDADERPGGRTVVVLSHEMWQRYFSLDPGDRRTHDPARRPRASRRRRDAGVVRVSRQGHAVLDAARVHASGGHTGRRRGHPGPGDRTTEARRVARAGIGRGQHVQNERRDAGPDRARSPEGRARRAVQAGADDPPRVGRLRPAHRVRERREPPAVARGEPAKGDRRAEPARREPRTADSPGVDTRVCFWPRLAAAPASSSRTGACRWSPRSIPAPFHG